MDLRDASASKNASKSPILEDTFPEIVGQDPKFLRNRQLSHVFWYPLDIAFKYAKGNLTGVNIVQLAAT